MSNESDTIYLEVSKLLKDICQFLDDDNKLSALKPQERKTANRLIERSKLQLQEIAKITDYVDMDLKKGPISEGESLELYVSIDDMSPYSDQSAKNVSFAIKYGFVSWRVKVFLKFEKMKRIYAVLYENWLLLYINDKEERPFLALDLKYYEAKIIENNKTQRFFEVSYSMKSITYTFTALTYKDMIQWVTLINKFHDKAVTEGKIEISSNEIKNYKIIQSPKPQKKTPQLPPPSPDQSYKSDEDDDGIYVCVDETNIGNLPKKMDVPPELPKRPSLGQPKYLNKQNRNDIEEDDPLDEYVTISETDKSPKNMNLSEREEESISDLYMDISDTETEKKKIQSPNVSYKPNNKNTGVQNIPNNKITTKHNQRKDVNNTNTEILKTSKPKLLNKPKPQRTTNNNLTRTTAFPHKSIVDEDDGHGEYYYTTNTSKTNSQITDKHVEEGTDEDTFSDDDEEEQLYDTVLPSDVPASSTLTNKPNITEKPKPLVRRLTFLHSPNKSVNE